MFVHPHILWLLPLALIPILIYYLMRFRSLRVAWGAHYVLELALARLRRRLYLDQIILLALRALLCLALVFAFARPLLRRAADRLRGSGVHHIVVVDNSYSLLAEGRDGRTLWEAQQDTLRRLVASWGRGERWSLLVAGPVPEWRVRAAEITTPDAALAVLGTLAPAERAASLGPALTAALEACGDEPAELFLLADDQALSWDELPDGLPARPRRPMVWIRATPRTRANLAVTSLRARPASALAGHPFQVEVRLRNFGTDPVGDTALELLVDGRFEARTSVALLPGQESRAEFRVAIDTPGAHYLTARLPRDVLPPDDEAHAGLDVKERLRLVVCRDPDRSGTFDSAAGFLHLAADVMRRPGPDKLPLFTGAPLVVETLAPPYPADALRQADVIVLDAGVRPTPELAATLDALLRDGAVLLLAPDDSVDAQLWNTILGGAGLLPARLGAAVSEPPGGERGNTLAGTSLKFFSWLTLTPDPRRAEILQPFADGSPYAVALRRRPGTVLLLASGLNGRVNNLIVSRDFVPFTVGLLNEAVARGAWPRVVAPGEPITLGVRTPQTLTGATFRLGAEPAVPLAPAPVLRLAAGAPRSGLGSVLLLGPGEPERVWLGVQGPRSDSDLTPLDPARERAVREALALDTADSWAELETILQRGRQGREWQGLLLLAALLFLAGEMLMEWRFV